MTEIKRPPPHDHEKERQLIGSLLLVPAYITEAAGIVKPEDFHDERHGAAFSALVQMGAQSADVMTVCDAMTRAGVKDALTEGDLAGMMTETSYASNFSHYARAIADDATRRRVLDACSIVARTAFDPTTSAAEVLSVATREITRAGKGVARDRPNLQQIAAEYIARRQAETATGGKPTGIPSGLGDLDRITNGWRPGQLVTIAAPSGHGKTTLMLQCALNAARKGYRVLILTLEMAEDEIFTKLVACFGQLNNAPEVAWKKDEEARAAEAVRSLPLDILFKAGATVGELMTECHRAKAIYEALDLVVVDYVGIMGTTQERGQTRAAAIGAITRELKAQAGKLGAAILLGSQLNREGSSFAGGRAPEPQLFHMRESGNIEEDSSIVLMLHDPQEKSSPEHRTIYVRKNRSGRLGKVDLLAKWPYARFYEAEISSEPLENLA